MNVGVREFRLRLSEYVRRARGGESLTITNRGSAVARLAAIHEPAAAAGGVLRESRANYDADAAPAAHAGIRQLKARLADYLRLVRQGEVIVITERDRPIAELREPEVVPIEEFRIPSDILPDEAVRMKKALSEDPPPPELWPLLRKGLIIWLGRRREPLPEPYQPPADYDGPTLFEILMKLRHEE